MKNKDKEFLQRAIDLGYKGVESKGGNAIGAVIVKDGKIIAEGHNTVKGSNDPTAHGEVVVIRQAGAYLNSPDLSECTIYTSAEPCPMCVGAIFWAKIDRVVYAVEKDKLAEYENFKDEELLKEIRQPLAKRSIEYKQLLREEGIQLLEKKAAEKED